MALPTSAVESSSSFAVADSNDQLFEEKCKSLAFHVAALPVDVDLFVNEVISSARLRSGFSDF